MPYNHAWCISERTGTVQTLIDEFKFGRKRAVYRVLAELCDEQLPNLPKETCIVPIPTAPRNIRRRGYDHMALIAHEFARRRSIDVTPLLTRRNNVTQHFALTAKIRHEQAKHFFAISPECVVPNRHYLLMDDIFTSGATLHAAATCLREAGATSVDIVAIARQRR